MVDWIFSDETYTELYHQYFAEFLESVNMEEIIDSAAELIAPYVEKDPTKFYTYEEFETGVSTLREFCTLRTESVQGQLDGTIPSTSEGQSADSSALIDASHITISDKMCIRDRHTPVPAARTECPPTATGQPLSLIHISITYGIGHGGLECILILGMSMLSNLMLALVFNSMGAEEFIAQYAAEQADSIVASIQAINDVDILSAMLACLERVCAFILQIELSILVFAAVRLEKYWRFPLAILAHMEMCIRDRGYRGFFRLQKSLKSIQGGRIRQIQRYSAQRLFGKLSLQSLQALPAPGNEPKGIDIRAKLHCSAEKLHAESGGSAGENCSFHMNVSLSLIHI